MYVGTTRVLASTLKLISISYKADVFQSCLFAEFSLPSILYMVYLQAKARPKTWDKAPSAAWTKFTNSLKPAYTRDVQIKFDL